MESTAGLEESELVNQRATPAVGAALDCETVWPLQLQWFGDDSRADETRA
jgi:hypothetical protein